MKICIYCGASSDEVKWPKKDKKPHGRSCSDCVNRRRNARNKEKNDKLIDWLNCDLHYKAYELTPIDEDAVAAEQLGISYGKYKALKMEGKDVTRWAAYSRHHNTDDIENMD